MLYQDFNSSNQEELCDWVTEKPRLFCDWFSEEQRLLLSSQQTVRRGWHGLQVNLPKDVESKERR